MLLPDEILAAARRVRLARHAESVTEAASKERSRLLRAIGCRRRVVFSEAVLGRLDLHHRVVVCLLRKVSSDDPLVVEGIGRAVAWMLADGRTFLRDLARPLHFAPAKPDS